MEKLRQDPLENSLEETLLGLSFDINAAFQDALLDVASNGELALDERIRRMETIVQEGTSELYRDFVDFRAMAVTIDMLCNHDHQLADSIGSSPTLQNAMTFHGEEPTVEATSWQHSSEPRHQRSPSSGKVIKSTTKSKKKKTKYLPLFGWQR